MCLLPPLAERQRGEYHINGCNWVPSSASCSCTSEQSGSYVGYLLTYQEAIGIADVHGRYAAWHRCGRHDTLRHEVAHAPCNLLV